MNVQGEWLSLAIPWQYSDLAARVLCDVCQPRLTEVKVCKYQEHIETGSGFVILENLPFMGVNT